VALSHLLTLPSKVSTPSSTTQAIVVDAVGDTAHSMLPDSEPDIATGRIGRAKVTAGSNVVESASMKISTPTYTVDDRS
jgi:hypothetical protein